MAVLETFVAEPPPLRRVEGGAVRVGNTRVSLDTVIYHFQQGETPEAIVDAFDTLQIADVYAVISYYLRHREEIDAYLERRRIEAEEIRREVEARFPPGEFRERLLARQRAKTKP